MDTVRQSLELQHKAQQFLKALYLKSLSDRRNITVGMVVEGFGWSEEEIYDVEQYLKGKHLVYRRTAGRLDGYIEITSLGDGQMERALVKEGPMDIRQQILELQYKGKLFLHALYAQANGSPGELVPMRDIIQNFEWSEETCYRVEDYLKGKGLIKRQSRGGIDGYISITSAGVSQVERDVLQGYIPFIGKTALDKTELQPNEGLSDKPAAATLKPKKRVKRPGDDQKEIRLQRTKELWLSGEYDEEQLIREVPTSKATLYRDLNELERRGEIDRR